MSCVQAHLKSATFYIFLQWSWAEEKQKTDISRYFHVFHKHGSSQISKVFRCSSTHSPRNMFWWHIQLFSLLLPSNKRGTWVILYLRLCPLIFRSWTIQQALLPGDQYILSSAVQEHSLPAYMWHVVTGLHAVRLFIQHIRPAPDGPRRAERSLPYISSACRRPECICLESQSGRAVV